MTTTDLILWLYGLCFWGASLNFPAWLRLLLRPMAPARLKPWWTDVRYTTRLGLTVLSFGIAGLSGARVLDAVFSGRPIALPGVWVSVFVALMACAEPLFLRADEIHARDRGQKSIGWRLYWIGAVTGTVLLVVLRMTL